jgi:hypothetical protein
MPKKGYKQTAEHIKNNSDANKGNTHSEETKKKMREPRPNFAGENHPMYGKTLSEEHKKKLGLKGKNHPMFGKTHSEETKNKMSEAKEGENNTMYGRCGPLSPMYGRCGPLSPTWKGGISCEPYCDVWLDKEYKQYIKDRDGNVCLNPECNGISNKLCLHHINYNKKECEPLNLITICLSCNAKANFNRKWHQSWYKAIMYRRYNI